MTFFVELAAAANDANFDAAKPEDRIIFCHWWHVFFVELAAAADSADFDAAKLEERIIFRH